MAEVLTMDTIGLPDLLARVVVDCECWVWQGYCDHGRFPQWRVDGRNQAARRVVYTLVHGRIKPGWQVGARPGCVANCCHPDHLVARSKSKARRGMRMPATHRSRITRSRQATSALSWDDVRAIRASDMTCPALAAQYGVSRNHIWRIRKHVTWRDTRSPFAGLVAALAPVVTAADRKAGKAAKPAPVALPVTPPGTVAAMDASLARARALAHAWEGLRA